MGPENYLNAMSQPMYGFSSARVDVINPSNLYHVEVIPGLLPPEVPGQVQWKQVHDIDKYEEKELTEYLEFVHRFMKEQTMTSSGPLLVGGTRYEENALKLLEQCSHQESKDGSNDQISKYDLAKLHILYPTMMILHEQKFKNMTPKEIKHTVDSAMQGLSQVKEEKQKEIIANLWKMLEGGQVELEVIENFEQMLER